MTVLQSLLCLSLLTGSPLETPDRDRSDPANVILIMADDIGTECFGCYGGTSYATPHLDALASGGIRFTNCFSQPLCTPSRVKLMTGRSNIRNYVDFGILSPEEHTVGQLFRDAGYATGVAGKWQLLGRDNEALAGQGTSPHDAGFDTWCLWQVHRLGSRYWAPLLDHDGRLIQHDADQYGPDVFCEFLLDFIEEHRERPFFAYYPMALVHNPFVPTPASPDRKAKRSPRHFAEMVAWMDAIVGRITQRVEDLGLSEKTLILFTGDNGTNRAIRSATHGGEVRGGKGLTTRAGMHVPLIASLPGVIPAGGVCDDLVDFSDFLPTLADACHVTLPAGITIDGRSFWNQARGLEGRSREQIFCYFNPRPGKKRFVERCFVQDRRWKLYRDGRLFDLREDPLETQPVEDESDDSRAARTRLQAALEAMPSRPARIRQPETEKDS